MHGNLHSLPYKLGFPCTFNRQLEFTYSRYRRSVDRHCRHFRDKSSCLIFTSFNDARCLGALISLSRCLFVRIAFLFVTFAVFIVSAGKGFNGIFYLAGVLMNLFIHGKVYWDFSVLAFTLDTLYKDSKII